MVGYRIPLCILLRKMKVLMNLKTDQDCNIIHSALRRTDTIVYILEVISSSIMILTAVHRALSTQ